ncbi:unnamed protein product [Strongylus vulgaris]|uniref:Uncharacterized protein n=1 Tax=Strongylus vulgaris TaxID=40348 RepID=A0A3P7J974_STRVU|nr:unnamed protein product [Strongylus vulgaris]
MRSSILLNLSILFGLNRLGIYDVLNRPVKFDAVPSVLIPPQATSSSTTTASPVNPTTPELGKEELIEPEPIPIGVSEPDERMKKVIDLTASSRKKVSETTESPALTELIEEIGEDNVVTTTTQQLIEATSAKTPKPDVYRLLKTLNLTDEETNDLVSHVEKVRPLRSHAEMIEAI